MAKKKKSCILHFGTAKTGTTALQFGLTDYDDGETTYARFPISPDNPNHSEPLVVAGFGDAGIRECAEVFPRWNTSPDKLRWPNSIPMKMMQRLNHPPDARAHQAALAATIADVPHDRLIYSGEGLFSNPACAAGLIATLRQSFEKVEGICYLRACPGGFLSRFQQRLTASHPAMFFSDSLRGDLNQLIYNDAKFLKAWKEVLKDEGLTTAIYHPQDMKNGDIVDDFCDRMALDANRAKRIRTNVSFSAEAAAVLATLSVHGSAPGNNPYFERNKRFFNVLMYQFGKGKLTLSEGFADRLHAANKDALDWVDNVCSRAFTRDRDRGDYVIDRHEDLLDICENLLPELVRFLKKTAGLKLGREARSIEGFARSLSQRLCEQNPFRRRKLPIGFSAAQYLALNPDIARIGANPGQHFLANGCFEGRFY